MPASPSPTPGGGDTLTFVRAHDAGNGERPRVAWAQLAELDGTIVCLGGTRPTCAAWSTSCWRTAARGRHRRADQARHAGRPGDPRSARSASWRRRWPGRRSTAPLTLVVGKVVGLREHLRWFDQRPLFGRRVLVTRSRHQAAELVELLEAAGAEAIEAPVLRVAELDDFTALDLALDTASQCDWIVFTTVNGVDGFMRRLMERGRDVRALAGPRIGAAGVGTASRLARFGIRVDLGRRGARAWTASSPRWAALRAWPSGGCCCRRRPGGRDTLERSARRRRGRCASDPGVPHPGRGGQPGDRRLRPAAPAPHRRGDVHELGRGPRLRQRSTARSRSPICSPTRPWPRSVRPPPMRSRRLGVTPAIVPPVPSIPALVDAIRAHFQ